MHVESSLVLAAAKAGVLRISIDGDDRRIFWGLKSSIPEFLGFGKFVRDFFGGLI